ncbi:hypothetical protein ACF061_13665 [Streptomyces sp. NPDC015220]|uniref:hypothetical protein n=1 Tax=Streptomyces sp. NPDC015220 TaxID=3364947 RepID=UPI003700B879
MPIKSATATVRSRYAEQAAADLAENRRRQSELTRQLEALQQEEALLLNILSIAEHPAAVPEPAHVPQQAQNEPALEPAAAPSAVTPSPAADGTPAERPARTEEGGTARPRSTGSKRAAKSAAGNTGKKAAKNTGKTEGRQVLLRDLLLDLLSGHSEPRLAAELREELLEKHPDREPTPQVVRNTLEALVAKGRIQRHKQSRSVMYTVVEPGEGEASGALSGASVATA